MLTPESEIDRYRTEVFVGRFRHTYDTQGRLLMIETWDSDNRHCFMKANDSEGACLVQYERIYFVTGDGTAISTGWLGQVPEIEAKEIRIPREPVTEKEHRWLAQEVRARLAPGGSLHAG